jgi:serine/threonine protein kinase
MTSSDNNKDSSRESEEYLEELIYHFREELQACRHPHIENFLKKLSEPLQIDFLIRAIESEMEYRLRPTIIQLEVPTADDSEARVLPRLELYVHRFQQLRKSERAAVTLSLFEFAFHVRTDAPIPIADYVAMFPDFAEKVRSSLQRAERQLLRGPVVERGKQDVDLKSDTVIDNTLDPLPTWKLPRILGCFQLLSVLGTGGMGTVFRAFDLRTGAIVAVKVTRRLDAWSIYRFTEEFRALASIQHPHLIKLFESFNDGQVRYFSMELISGRKLHRWWTSQTQSNRWELFRSRMSQIASAIHYLHSRGVVHSDIKCNNIIVTGNRAVLLDFGLASFFDPELHPTTRVDSDRIAGTLVYLAPEILEGSPSSTASDWYSFGVVLFELITGKLPFTTTERSGQLSLPPDDMESLRATQCPQEIADLCYEILKHDPTQRAGAPQVFAALQSASYVALPRAALDGLIAHVGREETISSVLHTVTNEEPKPRLLIIHGSIGVGRSRFLSECVRRLSSPNRTIIRASGFRQDIGKFGLTNLLVQSFITATPERFNVLEHIDESQLELISRAFPQILQLMQGAGHSSGTRQAAVSPLADGANAFYDLLAKIGKSHQVVIAIDDFQWSDSASLLSLQQFLSEVTGTNFVIMVTIRSEGEDSDDEMVKIRNWTQPFANREGELSIAKFELSELGVSESQAFARSMLTRIGIDSSHMDACSEMLAKACHGKPQFVIELLRILLDAGVPPDQWPQRIIELEKTDPIEFRFSRLERPHQQILQFMAVATEPTTFSHLQMASRLGPDLLLPVLGDLASRGWIQWRGRWPDLSVDLTQEATRKRIIRITPSDRLARRHGRWAQILSREPNPPWKLIAEHLSATGSERRAAVAFLEAGKAAMRNKDFREAFQASMRALESNSLSQQQQSVAESMLTEARLLLAESAQETTDPSNP